MTQNISFLSCSLFEHFRIYTLCWWICKWCRRNRSWSIFRQAYWWHCKILLGRSPVQTSVGLWAILA